MNGHLVSDDELLAYAVGELDETRMPAIAAHIAACAECAAAMEKIVLVRETVRADAALVPSVDALARVRALIAGRARSRPERASVFASLNHVVASLTFDGRSPMALAGLRGGTTAYVLRYALDTLDLDLEIEPAGGAETERWRVTGQISTPDPVGPRPVAIAEAGSLRPILELATDDDGMFFAELPAGTYDVLIQLDDDLVVAPSLEVG
jgi:anti-sigma factor RsiW